jgi:hypothetical protein
MLWICSVKFVRQIGPPAPYPAEAHGVESGRSTRIPRWRQQTHRRKQAQHLVEVEEAGRLRRSAKWQIRCLWQCRGSPRHGSAPGSPVNLRSTAPRLMFQQVPPQCARDAVHHHTHTMHVPVPIDSETDHSSPRTTRRPAPPPVVSVRSLKNRPLLSHSRQGYRWLHVRADWWRL